MYLELAKQLYNSMFTFLPVFIFSLIDRDVSDETSRALPQLYHIGECRREEAAHQPPLPLMSSAPPTHELRPSRS